MAENPRTNTTSYQHPQETNLLNVHKAMQYNNAGEPVLRTHVNGITLEGNVIVSNVTIDSGNVTVWQGTDPWVVTGNVGVTGNVNVTQGSSPWHVDGNVNATITGTSTVTLGTGSTDAFGRLRVSEPYTLFDSALLYRRKYHYSTSTSTGGNVTFDYDASVRNMTVTGASGSEVVRESKRVFPYQPGKSLLVLNTFVMSPAKTNLRQRVGFFSATNGIYFEQTNGTKNLVIRSSSSGSLVEERIAQSSWNGDRLDGTGASGITLDLTAPQIFWTDVEWLGVGSVRCGFVINGQYYLCHTFHHANNPVYTTTYMTTATLPVRYEITNTGATTGSSTMQQICSTVISEGGYNQFNVAETAGTGINVKRLTTAGTYYPIVSVRLASNRLNSIVIPRQVDILSPTVNYYRWQLLYNATLTGATWSGLSQSGTVEYDTAATAVSGGTEIQSGYATSRELNSLLDANMFQFQIGRNLDGTSDTVTLVITATSNNADILAQLGWQELT